MGIEYEPDEETVVQAESPATDIRFYLGPEDLINAYKTSFDEFKSSVSELGIRMESWKHTTVDRRGYLGKELAVLIDTAEKSHDNINKMLNVLEAKEEAWPEFVRTYDASFFEYSDINLVRARFDELVQEQNEGLFYKFIGMVTEYSLRSLKAEEVIPDLDAPKSLPLTEQIGYMFYHI